MTPLLAVTVKTTLLVLFALAAVVALRRQSAAARHWVLTAAFLGCLWLPALDALVPAWPVPVPASWLGTSAVAGLRFVDRAPGAVPSGTATQSNSVLDAPGAGGPQATVVVFAVWIAGVAVGLGALAAGLVRLRRMAARAELVCSGQWRTLADEVSARYGLRRPVFLFRCRHPTMLATWGTVWPAILLPAGSGSWADARIRVVLQHELAHIQRGDWLVMLMARAVKAVFWFNPLLWIAFRRLRHEGERACDDLVIASGVSGADYATHLLDVARESARHRHPWSPAIAVAHYSMLEGRVRAMLNDRVNRAPLTVFARLATIVLLTLVTVVIGAATMSGSTAIVPAPEIQLARPEVALPPLSRADPGLRSEMQRTAAAAQTSGATIEGVLYDQFGGLLPGAAVRLTSLQTGSLQNAVTSRGGAFVFRDLPPADYELVTELAGFITVRNVVRAEPGATVRRHITLPIGSIQETITVTCSASENAFSRPTAPSASATPGPAPRQRAPDRLGAEPTIPSTFSGGIGGQIKVPIKVSHVNPVCPAGVAPVPTVVRLVGRIGIDGFITDLRAASDNADAAYVASSMEAVRQWTFTPTLLNGAPIEVNITIAVDYGWAN